MEGKKGADAAHITENLARLVREIGKSGRHPRAPLDRLERLHRRFLGRREPSSFFQVSCSGSQNEAQPRETGRGPPAGAVKDSFDAPAGPGASFCPRLLQAASPTATPPSAHGMVVRLEELGHLTRERGVPRSMRVAVPESEIPVLEPLEGPSW